ncbi:hypothetical protein EAVNNN508_02529 [Elizabethkingia anophelis]|nr:hypothetical protein EAVNVB490_02072 [Elizabethkingia anophelis]CAI9671130.1 hypothetical protein EAVNNN508_02212 [Elizabethkingia anophelis]CAI9675136.1 hypothetical protein EAVNVB490_02532 [Elizabethkingia anophelis]CAI9683919.1 hypothetical protein EAVNNN508_02529 [Elizabethkingia anophelis]
MEKSQYIQLGLKLYLGANLFYIFSVIKLYGFND